MNNVVPICGLLFVLLAAYTAIAEIKRSLVASGGNLVVLRPFGIAWLVAFGISCVAGLVLKNITAYLAMAGLALIAWIAIPAAIYIGWKIRTEGPMGVGRRR